MATKQCIKCGKRIVGKSTVCPYCGESQDKSISSTIAQKSSEKTKINDNMTTCKTCGEPVSKNAKTCPHCGELLLKSKEENKKTSMWTWLVLLLFIGYLIETKDNGFTEQNNAVDNSKQTREERAREEALCKKDLQCWGDKNIVTASVYCKDNIEKLAKYSHEWTDGMLESKFSRFRWKDKNKGSITYTGDKIKFQNGFGAWTNYTYECDIDPLLKTVIGVRASPGRL